jgi:hypothetical protein
VCRAERGMARGQGRSTELDRGVQYRAGRSGRVMNHRGTARRSLNSLGSGRPKSSRQCSIDGGCINLNTLIYDSTLCLTFTWSRPQGLADFSVACSHRAPKAVPRLPSRQGSTPARRIPIPRRSQDNPEGTIRVNVYSLSSFEN